MKQNAETKQKYAWLICRLCSPYSQ